MIFTNIFKKTVEDIEFDNTLRGRGTFYTVLGYESVPEIHVCSYISKRLYFGDKKVNIGRKYITQL